MQALFFEAPAPVDNLVLLINMSTYRKSRRLLDLDPKSNDDVPNASSKELKNLLTKGGTGGQAHKAHEDWNYFPKRAKRTESMISVSELERDIKEMTRLTEEQEKNDSFNSTYLLLHVNQIEDIANHNCNACKK